MIITKNQNKKLKTFKAFHSRTINKIDNNDVNFKFDNEINKEQQNSDLNEGNNFNKYNIILNTINEN